MTLSPVTAAKARAMADAGALLVDVREPNEHAHEKIAGSHLAPLSRPGRLDARAANNQVIFYCKSGMRTRTQAARLAASTDAAAFLLEGGIEAWKQAGLPVDRQKREAIPIMRQVQIIAGALVLAGVALGAALHPGFYGLAGFVGAGLMFAGASGICMMARLLAHAPWNRDAA